MCLTDAAELEWKLVYVGAADDEKLDQELDSVLVGPIAIGKNEFDFVVRFASARCFCRTRVSRCAHFCTALTLCCPQAPAPDASKIPKKDLM